MDRQTTATGTALLRFAIIGPLLASPPPRGRLQAAIQTLSEQEWTTPDGRTRRFSAATIERWVLHGTEGRCRFPWPPCGRRRRSDAGHRRSVSDALLAAVREQYAIWPWWSVELHHRNLAARADGQPDLGPLPSPSTLRRVMREHGLVRRSRSGFRRLRSPHLHELRGPLRKQPLALGHPSQPACPGRNPQRRDGHTEALDGGR